MWAEETVAAPGPAPVSPLRRNEEVLDEADDWDIRAQELHADVRAQFDAPLHLTLTDNSSSMMSLRYRKNGVALLRLHHMFLDAPPKVRNALAQWLKRPRAQKAGDVIDTFIKARRHLIQEAPVRRVRLRTEGRHHDLTELYKEVNRKFFDEKIGVPITWGRMPGGRRKRRRSIHFGSYAPLERLIRIHPLLDAEFVPRFFVRYIVFHEMLHALLGIKESPSGRRSIHTPEFNTIERGFPDYKKAAAWMDNAKNMRRLLDAGPGN